MATRLTPLGLILKWLIVPAALGTAGYFLIGPEIGKNETAIKAAQRVGIPVPGKVQEPEDEKLKEEDKEKVSSRRRGEPEVEVSAEKYERPPRRSSRRRKSSRRYRRRRSTSEERRAYRFVLPSEQRLA